MTRALASLALATAGLWMIRASGIERTDPRSTVVRPSRPRPTGDVCERAGHAWITEAGVRRCERRPCERWEFVG